MFKKLRNEILDSFFDDINNVSDNYQKVVATIMIILSTLGAITFGTIAVFGHLAEAGCAVTISTMGFIGAGLFGLSATFVGVFLIAFVLYGGLAAIPNWIAGWKNRQQTTLSHKAEITKEWFVEYWPVIAVILGTGLAIVLASWGLGYAAWLIAC